MKHSVQCSQCGAARPVDTDTWSLEEPCEECEHGEDSAQVNSRTTREEWEQGSQRGVADIQKMSPPQL